ncbi:TPA: hypothetical protein DEP58_02525 [Patescibacteria group bacterium]|nr:MAG: Methyltransferase type 11 [Parcubacteria group bacterium GW2011_GWD2_42_14]HCC05159.1 hypothetical protein [Patescibacteria group bacterium]
MRSDLINNNLAMDNKTQTITTYNDRAQSWADKFDSSGTRVSDINETFALIQKDSPRVLEIGCGNGRDAQEILKHTYNYLGVDASEKLVELAKQKVPNGQFLVADIEEYTLPTELDLVFAFASLIHIPKQSLQKIFHTILASLNKGGAFRLSVKYAEEYMESTKTDEFGTRTFYLYSDDDIKEMAQGFTIVKNKIVGLKGKKWLEVLMQK